jgi:hypothetical protein
MLNPRGLTAIVLGGLTLTVAGNAAAYCRTTTCNPDTEDCSPALGEECTDKGMPLYWPNRCVGFNLQKDASPEIPFDTFTAITRASFASWLAADCGGSPPSIDIHDLGAISCGAAEYNQYTGNANIILFRNTSWPYTDSSHTLALTTVTFNTKTAEIYDVDIEVNAAQVHITTSDTDAEYDLQAILTHEIGHFFGLAHSGNAAATMYARYKRGTLELRSLEQDDLNGICAAYPQDRNAVTCDPTPRRGLKDSCGDAAPAEDDGCALTTSGPGTMSRGAVGAAIAALVAVARLRRKRNGT